MFLLDTNLPSGMLRTRPDENVDAWVKRQASETLFITPQQLLITISHS